MKRNRLLMSGLVCLVLLAVIPLGACAQPAPAPAPAPQVTVTVPAPAPAPAPPPVVTTQSIVVSPLVVPLSSGSVVIIAGADFKPKQKFGIMIYDPTYTISNDILGIGDPIPEVNAQGAWMTTVTLGNLAGRIITQGVYYVRAVNEDGVVLASTPIAFVDVSKPRADWPTWAKAAIPAK